MVKNTEFFKEKVMENSRLIAALLAATFIMSYVPVQAQEGPAAIGVEYVGGGTVQLQLARSQFPVGTKVRIDREKAPEEYREYLEAEYTVDKVFDSEGETKVSMREDHMTIRYEALIRCLKDQ